MTRVLPLLLITMSMFWGYPPRPAYSQTDQDIRRRLYEDVFIFAARDNPEAALRLGAFVAADISRRLILAPEARAAIDDTIASLRRADSFAEIQTAVGRIGSHIGAPIFDQVTAVQAGARPLDSRERALLFAALSALRAGTQQESERVFQFVPDPALRMLANRVQAAPQILDTLGRNASLFPRPDAAPDTLLTYLPQPLRQSIERLGWHSGTTPTSGQRGWEMLVRSIADNLPATPSGTGGAILSSLPSFMSGQGAPYAFALERFAASNRNSYGDLSRTVFDFIGQIGRTSDQNRRQGLPDAAFFGRADAALQVFGGFLSDVALRHNRREEAAALLAIVEVGRFALATKYFTDWRAVASSSAQPGLSGLTSAMLPLATGINPAVALTLSAVSAASVAASQSAPGGADLALAILRGQQEILARLDLITEEIGVLRREVAQLRTEFQRGNAALADLVRFAIDRIENSRIETLARLSDIELRINQAAFANIQAAHRELVALATSGRSDDTTRALMTTSMARLNSGVLDFARTGVGFAGEFVLDRPFDPNADGADREIVRTARALLARLRETRVLSAGDDGMWVDRRAVEAFRLLSVAVEADERGPIDTAVYARALALLIDAHARLPAQDDRFHREPEVLRAAFTAFAVRRALVELSGHAAFNALKSVSDLRDAWLQSAVTGRESPAERLRELLPNLPPHLRSYLLNGGGSLVDLYECLSRRRDSGCDGVGFLPFHEFLSQIRLARSDLTGLNMSNQRVFAELLTAYPDLSSGVNRQCVRYTISVPWSESIQARYSAWTAEQPRGPTIMARELCANIDFATLVDPREWRAIAQNRDRIDRILWNWFLQNRFLLSGGFLPDSVAEARFATTDRLLRRVLAAEQDRISTALAGARVTQETHRAIRSLQTDISILYVIDGLLHEGRGRTIPLWEGPLPGGSIFDPVWLTDSCSVPTTRLVLTYLHQGADTGNLGSRLLQQPATAGGGVGAHLAALGLTQLAVYTERPREFSEALRARDVGRLARLLAQIGLPPSEANQLARRLADDAVKPSEEQQTARRISRLLFLWGGLARDVSDGMDRSLPAVLNPSTYLDASRYVDRCFVPDRRVLRAVGLADQYASLTSLPRTEAVPLQDDGERSLAEAVGLTRSDQEHLLLTLAGAGRQGPGSSIEDRWRDLIEAVQASAGLPPTGRADLNVLVQVNNRWLAAIFAERPPPPVLATSRRDCPQCPEMVRIAPRDVTVFGSLERLREWGERAGQMSTVVNVQRPFRMARTEVTVRQWNACVAAGSCPPVALPRNIVVQRLPEQLQRAGHTVDVQERLLDFPVISVTYDEALRYVAWLNRQAPGRNYRIPSEAEWHVARGAASNRAAAGSTMYGLYSANCRGCGPSRLTQISGSAPVVTSIMTPLPVASLPPTITGLFDMDGNVSEMTSDCISNRDILPAYPHLPGLHPTDGPNCPFQRRVVVGSSFLVRDVSFRYGMVQNGRWEALGFRVASDE